MSTLATLCVSTVVCGQEFINLDFEDAVVQPLPPDNITLEWSFAVPGWNSGLPFVYYREGPLGVEPFYLLMDSTSPAWAPGTQLAGNYSLAFASGYAGNDPFSGLWLNAGITQSGLVPSWARSIRMLGTGPFQVILGSVEIPMFFLGGNSYGGDISGFAGQTAELKILNTASVGDVGHGSVVDNILFSPEAIPEPSTIPFLVMGALLLGRRISDLKLEPPHVGCYALSTAHRCRSSSSTSSGLATV